MEQETIMNQFQEIFTQVEILGERVQDLNREKVIQLYEIAADTVILTTKLDCLHKLTNLKFLVKLSEQVAKTVYELLPCQVEAAFITKTSHPDITDKLYAVSQLCKKKSISAESYAVISLEANIWRVRHQMALQNISDSVCRTKSIAVFLHFHDSRVLNSWKKNGEVPITKEKSLFSIQEALYDKFEFIRFREFNTEEMKLIRLCNKPSKLKKPPAPKNNKTLMACSHSPEIVEEDEEQYFRVRFPKHNKRYNTFNEEAETQVINGVNKCMDILHGRPKFCMVCFLPQLVRACEPLHNIPLAELLSSPKKDSIVTYMSNIRWMIAHVDLDSYTEMPEITYIAFYMELMGYALHLECRDSKSVEEENTVDIPRHEINRKTPLWITTEKGQSISLRQTGKWEKKLSSLASSSDALAHSPSSECPMCFEDLASMPDFIITLNCRHIFCVECHFTNFFNYKKK